MVTLWIGDFRTKQLQKIYNAAQQTAEYHYIVDDLAEYSWFKDNAATQLPLLSLENANIAIMLGFNDCAYSCIWDTFKVDRIAEQYASTINTLVEDYTNFNFYVCSVNPVDADYPFAESKNGVIKKSQLNEKIGSFNNILKEKCKAEYIDSYDYLVNTNFETRDGVRYTYDTCLALHNYISTNFKSTASAVFLPRLVAPNSSVDTFLYWTHTGNGEGNPFPIKDNNSGSTLPSCEAYAWGRFYEILGETPALSTSEAKTWYAFSDGYKRGDTPRIGAIACWAGNAAGFVAVVEQVKEDGSIITSESGWDNATEDDIWRLIERTKGDGNWGMPTSYTFQGFVYGPQTASASKEDICAKNSYSISIDEMKPNAKYIYQYLSSKGWTLNAIAGLLGNLQEESKMSPAIWESLIDGTNADGTLNMTAINNYYSDHGRYPGFGLVQWTPYSKYTEWCTEQGLVYFDIDSQLQRIDYEAEHKLQWMARPNKGYDLTFNDFISSTRDASWLAAAFAFCYERPARSTGTEAEQAALRAERGANGDFWYNYLSTLSLDISSDSRIKISNFKIDGCQATVASASFLARSGITGKCILLKNNSEVDNRSFTVKAGYKAITFENLIPATEYVIRIETDNGEGEKLVRELLFETLQDYPEAVKNIEFNTSDKIKGVDSQFNLSVTKPDHLGYWRSNSGYDVCLIINNKSIKTITINNASQSFSWANFDLLTKFGYKSSLSDSVQIGIQPWVKDNKGTKLYSSSGISTSKPICLLNNPIQAYLNK